MTLHRLTRGLAAALSGLLLTASAGAQTKVDPEVFGAITARAIGPAAMSGRVSALDAVQRDPRILYVGAAAGGVWKSRNGGVTFKPVFDKPNLPQAIGALAINQTNPDTVWVGTGEPWVRNSVSVGGGVFVTTDGGDNWKKMGLDNVERIGRIVLHPTDPNTLWVAGLGALWGPSEHRGLYMTTDGGKTWTKTLYVDVNTGVSDVAIDPSNPSILYASTWEFRRLPYFFNSGGAGSALYKSTDGGKTWAKLTHGGAKGLPGGKLGRIAVSVSPAKPERVFALVEADTSAMYRSDDRGATWERTNKTNQMGMRPFYFANILADPVDPDRVWRPMLNLLVSTDGGKRFNVPYAGGGNVHSDLHPIWVSRQNNQHIYIGTDGGVYVSGDQGKTWRFLRNLPLSQFYHVAVDNEVPYNVYGGLQDNGSWVGPSSSPGGVENADWKNMGGGDGFTVLPDPRDAHIVYWQYQGGNFNRKDRRTQESKFIRPFIDNETRALVASTRTKDLRFNWNAPITFSPDGQRLYVGAQFLYRSTNRGDSWERISPDLTTNDPAKQKQNESGGLTIDNSTAENHCTIITMAESPRDANTVWVGTDDGNLQVTRDGGKTWTNVTKNVPGVPPFTWVSSVSPGNASADVCYVTFDGHRSGDMAPYVFKTTDGGKSWTALADGNIRGYCHKVLEDLVNPNLVFVGAEHGLYLSIDGGRQWAQFTGQMPAVPVFDMVIHPRENDLVLATHGRGIMIVDDLTPLRALSAQIIEQDFALLPARKSLIKASGGQQGFEGDDEFAGSNAIEAAQITYYLKKRQVFGALTVEIISPEGKVLQKLDGSKRRGINRVTWAIRRKAPRVPPSNELSGAVFVGPTYPPGDYTVRITREGGKVAEGKLTIGFDPHLPHSDADRQLQFKTATEGYEMLEELAYLDKKVTTLRDDAKARIKDLKPKDALHKQATALADKFEALHKTLVATSEAGGISGEEQLREKIATIYGGVINYLGRPTDSQLAGQAELKRELDAKLAQAQTLIDKDLAALNAALVKAKKEPLKVLSREEFFKD